MTCMLNKLFNFISSHLNELMWEWPSWSIRKSESHPNPAIESQMLKQKLHGYGHGISIFKNLPDDSNTQLVLKTID